MSVPANDTLLRALRREPTPHTPVWLMRQAGRYLPEYNAVRAKAGSFMALAQNPDYATEVKDGAFYGWPFSYIGRNARVSHNAGMFNETFHSAKTLSACEDVKLR